MITVNFDPQQILDLLDKSKARLHEFAVEFIQDLNQKVVEATPYKTGNLRGSWYAGLNGEPDAASGPPDAGGAAIARMNLVAAELKLGDVYYAVNGANYAGFVENGTSKMAGRFFVAGTVNEAPAIAEATAARLAAE